MVVSPAAIELESQSAGQAALLAVEARFSTQRERVADRRRIYYDTFDWRVHRSGGVLTAADNAKTNVLRWETRDGHLQVRLLAAGDLGFVWQLPEGTFRDSLAPVIEMRRLLPLVRVVTSGEMLRLLDTNQKTVVRLMLVGGSAASCTTSPETKSLPPLLRTLPVKGYDRDHRDLVRFLSDELQLEPKLVPELDLALTAIGRQAGDYSSKLDLELDPTMRPEEAVKVICRALCRTILANEEGVRQDLDSEFLHDFRVAVRRTRSALSQLKEQFPQEIHTHYRTEFAWLGEVTGPTRDLDVYLLNMPEYGASLPAAAGQELEPLGGFLHRRQQQERSGMLEALDSDRYRRLLAGWQEFLAKPTSDQDNLPVTAPSIKELASRRIWKAYRGVLKQGRAIGPGSPADSLHQLRIDGKKLRYLLEFFRSLYPAAEITPLIQALKRLQDNLGNFNDFRFQQESLTGFAGEIAQEKLAPVETLMAMGRLVERLEAGQDDERSRFDQIFARFSSPTNRSRFRRLFKPRKSSES